MEQDTQTFCTCLYIFPAERKFNKGQMTYSRSNNVCDVVENLMLIQLCEKNTFIRPPELAVRCIYWLRMPH